MKIVHYKNIIFYNGIFYTNKENIQSCATDNRLPLLFAPSDITTLALNEELEIFDYGILLLNSFHWNIAHMMWDFMYPSWYGLYNNYPEHADNVDFQWLTLQDINDQHVYTHKNIIETFSGRTLTTINLLTQKHQKPLLIPWLISGLEDIGIGNIDKTSLCAKKGHKINNIDPIEMFVNRMYSRYNIKRIVLSNESNCCNNIIYIINKRPYFGIAELFKKMSDKYGAKYNFNIVNYKDLSFYEQLKLLNNTCICIVGVGTARANTPFLPNCSIEIQTFEHNHNSIDCLDYVDYHLGTLSENVKIYNIPCYINEEATNFLCSKYLEEYLEHALDNIPVIVPIDIENNIPEKIKKLKNHKKYDINFDIWRNNFSNRIEDLFILLNN